MADSPENKPGKSQDQKTVPLSVGVSFSGEAKGSQAILLALAVAATLSLLGGLIAGGAALALSMIWLAIGCLLPIVLGFLGWWKCLQLWSKSQPSLDQPQHAPVLGNMSVKSGNGTTEITMSGTDSLVLQESNRDFMLELMCRFFSQQPLPLPVGQVQGSPADTRSLHLYSSAEAEQVKSQIDEHVAASHRQLGEALHKMGLKQNSCPEEGQGILIENKEEAILVSEDDRPCDIAANLERTESASDRARNAEMSRRQKLSR